MAEHIQRFGGTAADEMWEDLVVVERGCTVVASTDRGLTLEWRCVDCHLGIVGPPKGHVEFLRGLASVAPSWAKKS